MAFHLALGGTEVTAVLATHLTATFGTEQILHDHPDPPSQLIHRCDFAAGAATCHHSAPDHATVPLWASVSADWALAPPKGLAGFFKSFWRNWGNRARRQRIWRQNMQCQTQLPELCLVSTAAHETPAKWKVDRWKVARSSCITTSEPRLRQMLFGNGRELPPPHTHTLFF